MAIRSNKIWGSFADFRIDDIKYSWNEAQNGYSIDLSAFGQAITWEDAKGAFKGKESFLEDILAANLGSQYLLMSSMSSEGDKIEIGGMDLNHDGDPEYLLRVGHQAVCNDGCPVFLFTDLNKPAFAKLSSETDDIVISDVVEDGKLKAIYTGTEEGFAKTWLWDSDVGVKR